MAHERDPDFETVTLEIRDAIQSRGDEKGIQTQAALTVKEIEEEYKRIHGAPVPFQKHGYSRLDDMLKDMPEAIGHRFDFNRQAELYFVTK